MSSPDVLAVSVSDAPFWAWWLAPVAVTAVVAGAAAIGRRERRPRDGFEAVNDYRRFRMAMTDVRRPPATTGGAEHLPDDDQQEQR